jgi:two-component system chemotaxis sensor kinase CheA
MSDFDEQQEQDELVKEFLIESYENLDNLDRELVALESNPDDTERMSAVFRTIHTIKGTAGFLAYSKLEALTHVAENLLSKLRDGSLQLNEDRTDGLLRAVDSVREILGSIESDGNEGDGDYSQLMEDLKGLLLDGGVVPPVTTAAAPTTEVAPYHSGRARARTRSTDRIGSSRRRAGVGRADDRTA